MGSFHTAAQEGNPNRAWQFCYSKETKTRILGLEVARICGVEYERGGRCVERAGELQNLESLAEK